MIACKFSFNEKLSLCKRHSKGSLFISNLKSIIVAIFETISSYVNIASSFPFFIKFRYFQLCIYLVLCIKFSCFSPPPHFRDVMLRKSNTHMHSYISKNFPFTHKISKYVNQVKSIKIFDQVQYFYYLK